MLPTFKCNCLACHGGDDSEADLVFETPKTILKGSEDGPVVVPRHGERSKLLKTTTKESKPFMPNNKVGAEALKPEELAVIKDWIDQGATGTVNARLKPVVWRPLPPGLHPILALAVTSDGQFAACGLANQIFIYQVATGQVVVLLTDPKLAEASSRSGYNASRHKVKTLDWHHFEALFLPSYSPDFNPIERLWLRLKADCFTDWIARSGAALEDRLCHALNHFMSCSFQTASICSIRK